MLGKNFQNLMEAFSAKASLLDLFGFYKLTWTSLKEKTHTWKLAVPSVVNLSKKLYGDFWFYINSPFSIGISPGLDRLIWLCEWLWLKTHTIFSNNQSQSCNISRLVLSGVHYDHFGFAFATYSPRVRVLYTGNVSFKLNILGWVMVKK